jgi:hypothetical protein
LTLQGLLEEFLVSNLQANLDIAMAPDKIHNLAEKRILSAAKLPNKPAPSRQNSNFKLSIYRNKLVEAYFFHLRIPLGHPNPQ